MRNACISIFLFSAAAACLADFKLTDTTKIVFATPEQGTEILARKDTYIQNLSPFDRSARLQTDQPVSEKEFLDFVGRGHTLAWSHGETETISAILEDIRIQLKPFSLPFPETVYMIKTTGAIEGGAAYTRSNAVIFPESVLQARSHLRYLVAHELFHVLSRANCELRSRLYAVIGFKPLPEPFVFPAELNDQKITNPDAPTHDHYIEVKYEGETRRAVPITYSRTEKYDVNLGGTFFSYLILQFVLLSQDGLPQTLADTYQLDGFMQQIGANTGYIIHPEEILADNFALIALNRNDVPSADIQDKIKAVLMTADTKQPPAQ